MASVNHGLSAVSLPSLAEQGIQKSMLSFTKAMRPDLLKITLLLGLCCPIQVLQAQALPAQASLWCHSTGAPRKD